MHKSDDLSVLVGKRNFSLTFKGGVFRANILVEPYFIIDNDLCQSIENAALCGVDVRIIVPHIPDMLKTGLFTRFVRSVVRIFAPML